MEVSVELTFTPLQDSFEAPVVKFIKRLRSSGLTVMENPLSTQVYGDYDKVMQLLQQEVKKAFDGVDHGLMHMKLVKSDRSDYEPDF